MNKPPAHRADAPPPVATEVSASHPAAPAAAPLPAGHAQVWGAVADHVARLLSSQMLDDEQDRLVHMRHFGVTVGAAVSRGDPVSRDDLERLAAAAIHWALDLPDPHPEDQWNSTAPDVVLSLREAEQQSATSGRKQDGGGAADPHHRAGGKIAQRRADLRARRSTTLIGAGTFEPDPVHPWDAFVPIGFALFARPVAGIHAISWLPIADAIRARLRPCNCWAAEKRESFVGVLPPSRRIADALKTAASSPSSNPGT